MNRKFAIAVAALVLSVPAAEAGGRHRHVDKRLTAVAIGVGAASTAAFFAINDWNWKWDNSSGLTLAGGIALTTVGCTALSPMVATAVLKRPLSYREAHVLIGSCVIPIVGGWLVNEAYNAHVFWAPDEKTDKKWRHRHAKK